MVVVIGVGVAWTGWRVAELDCAEEVDCPGGPLDVLGCVEEGV